MQLERVIRVARPHAEVAARLAEDDLLLTLFPDSESEIVERRGERRTVESHYHLLGQPGVAVFHFDRVDNGDIHFEKVCDGRIWRELSGSVLLESAGAETEVRLELAGRTKALVPERAIRAPLQEQLDQMSRALREHLGAPSA